MEYLLIDLAPGTYFARVDSAGAYHTKKTYALRIRTLPNAQVVEGLARPAG